MALVKELRQHVRDRRTLVMMLLPALFAPLMCLVLLLAQEPGAASPVIRIGITSNEGGAVSDHSALDVRQSLAGTPGGTDGDSEWEVASTATPWTDLIQGKYDLILVVKGPNKYELVASPLSMEAPQLVGVLMNSMSRAPGSSGDSDTPNLVEASVRDGVPNVQVSTVLEQPPAGQAVASYILPLLLLSLFSFAGSPIAVEAIAAEREQGSFESLRVLGASGINILLGKLGAVILASLLTGLASLVALLGVGKVEPAGPWNLGMDVVVESRMSAAQIVCIAAVTVSALVLSSSALLLASAMSGSSKEAQYWVSLIALLPVALGGASVITGVSFYGIALYLVPFANSARVVADSVNGDSSVWSAVLVVVVNLLFTLALLLVAAQRVFGANRCRIRALFMG
ncbi:ABC transporter permease [Rhodococcoides corynebacterioides]|uniref:ABC transporter permease n=1 Tax=Rhodococcoides corynebacterioides TaxID=53972 RepID=UPI001C9B4414|nr:ABC transporter permease [Rhodococcus corynebacterioides]MBY6350826.1 ABC transporter permease [Rhodococcus corynebacterioides]